MSSAVLLSPATSYEHIHSLLGHYARSYEDLQRVRVALGNRISACGREDNPVPTEALLDSMASMVEAEAVIRRALERAAAQHFMADWIAATRGVGLLGFARLFGATGSLDNFEGSNRVAKLWKYLGLHVVDGEGPRRKRGEPLTRTVGDVKGNAWSLRGRSIAFNLGEGFVKMGAGGPYREAYDVKRAEYLARPRLGLSGCPFGRVHKDRAGKILACVKEKDELETSAHVHAAALRFAVKRFLRDLLNEWHRRRAEMAAPG